jgi:hypothetical protein
MDQAFKLEQKIFHAKTGTRLKRGWIALHPFERKCRHARIFVSHAMCLIWLRRGGGERRNPLGRSPSSLKVGSAEFDGIAVARMSEGQTT